MPPSCLARPRRRQPPLAEQRQARLLILEAEELHPSLLPSGEDSELHLAVACSLEQNPEAAVVRQLFTDLPEVKSDEGPRRVERD